MSNMHRLFIEADNLQRRLQTMLIISYRASGDSAWTKRINKVLNKADTRVARRYRALQYDIINRANNGRKDAFREMIDPYAERQIANQLEEFGDADKVVVYVALTSTRYIYLLGKGGIPVSAIREAASLREFIMNLIGQYRFSGPLGDYDKIYEDDVESTLFKKFC